MTALAVGASQFMKNQADTNSSHPFSADRPITNAQADVLGRGSFAAALAQSIASWRGRDSLVVALYGPYGIGKTSVKNLVLEALGRGSPVSPLIIEFNPWQFAAQATIIESFFDEIGQAIGMGTIATGKDRKKLLERWERYSGYVKGTAGILESLRKPVALLFAVMPILLVIGVYIPAVIWILVVLSTLTALSMWVSGLSEHIVNVVRAHSLHAGTTLEDAKRNLAECAAALKSPVVIVLDDLDRLTPAQLLEVFQLVKVNADFPKLVYLLLLDREVVVEHISGVLKVNGQAYLEKIIQVGFDLPRLSATDVQKVLFSRLDAVLAQVGDRARFDQNRWSNIFVGGLQYYFSNLRDVNRFVSTLSFRFAGFNGADAFEVNTIDLIALEVIRVFDPRLYRGLSANKTVLTRSRSADSARRQADRTAVESLLNLTAEDERGWKRDFLSQIFPNVAWALDPPNQSTQGDANAWVRELRACAAPMFDRYFEFAIPEGELSQSDIERLLSSVSDRELLRRELEQLSVRGLTDAALNRLGVYRREIPVEHAVPFLTALFDIGDRLDSASTFPSSLTRASLIAIAYLKTDPDLNRRTDRLRQAIASTLGVALPIHLIDLQEQFAKRQESDDEMTIQISDLDEFKTLCVRKIADAGGDGRLFSLPAAATLFYAWQRWGGGEELKAFIQANLHRDQNVFAFLRAFVHTAISHSSGDYIGKEHKYINLSEIERFASQGLIDEALQSQDLESLLKEEQEAVSLFRKAQERRAQGKPDFGTSPLDLFLEN